MPAGFLGFFGTIRSALNAPENEVRGCLRIVDSTGKVLEIWSQWDYLFQGTNGPHKIKISPYDPQRRVWVVGETKHVIYVFSNDGKQLLQTLGVELATAEDDAHFGRPQDLAFLPDGSVLVADGLTNARIVKLDMNGKHLANWPNIRFPNHVQVTEPAPGGFGELHQFLLDSKGNVNMGDNVLGRPQKLTPKKGADPRHLIGQSVPLARKGR